MSQPESGQWRQAEAGKRVCQPAVAKEGSKKNGFCLPVEVVFGRTVSEVKGIIARAGGEH
ncbi:hypothetical protein ACI3LX_001999 [Candidozyma auris]